MIDQDPGARERHVGILRRQRREFADRYGVGDASVLFFDAMIRNLDAGTDSVQAPVAASPVRDVHEPRTPREDDWGEL